MCKTQVTRRSSPPCPHGETRLGSRDPACGRGWFSVLPTWPKAEFPVACVSVPTAEDGAVGALPLHALRPAPPPLPLRKEAPPPSGRVCPSCSPSMNCSPALCLRPRTAYTGLSLHAAVPQSGRLGRCSSHMFPAFTLTHGAPRRVQPGVSDSVSVRSVVARVRQIQGGGGPATTWRGTSVSALREDPLGPRTALPPQKRTGTSGPSSAGFRSLRS